MFEPRRDSIEISAFRVLLLGFRVGEIEYVVRQDRGFCDSVSELEAVERVYRIDANMALK